jgi:hypothetical protein
LGNYIGNKQNVADMKKPAGKYRKALIQRCRLGSNPHVKGGNLFCPKNMGIYGYFMDIYGCICGYSDDTINTGTFRISPEIRGHYPYGSQTGIQLRNVLST